VTGAAGRRGASCTRSWHAGSLKVLWELIRYLHVLAMAFFVGGQIVLAGAVVPTLGRGRNPDAMRSVARRFGWGTVVALAVLVPTGTAMAARYDDWDDTKLQVKLALVLVLGLLVLWHIRAPGRRELDAAIFAVSLVVVLLGLAIAH
jgi:hypothetical protein